MWLYSVHPQDLRAWSDEDLTHLMWDVNCTLAFQVENCSPSHSCLSPACNTNIHWCFHFQWSSFLDFCLCACLKLPLLSLEGWIPWFLSSVAIRVMLTLVEICPLAFPEAILVWVAYSQITVTLCLKTELVKETLTSYIGTTTVWKLRFASCFPPPP